MFVHKNLNMPYMDDYVNQALGQSASNSVSTKGNDAGNSASGTGETYPVTTNKDSSGVASKSYESYTPEEQKWIAGLPELDSTDACTKGCEQNDIVRVKECENVRARTALMLEKIGCPSNVTAKQDGQTSGGACGTNASNTCGNQNTGGTCGTNTCGNQNTNTCGNQNTNTCGNTCT